MRWQTLSGRKKAEWKSRYRLGGEKSGESFFLRKVVRKGE